MARKGKGKGKPGKGKADAPAKGGESKSPPGKDPALAQLRRDIDDAEARHRELLLAAETDYAHLRRTHLAAQLLWSLRSNLCYRLGDMDGARKAASTADENAKHAARLERDNIVDRITALERELELTRSLGRELANLE